MGSSKICPSCAAPGIKVDSEVVESATGREMPHDKSYACCESSCDVAYFCQTVTVSVSETRRKLWYKTDDMDCPICYCANITREDIKSAVQAGSRTIEDVETHLGRKGSKHCKSLNPLGKCCKELMKRMISEYS